MKRLLVIALVLGTVGVAIAATPPHKKTGAAAKAGSTAKTTSSVKDKAMTQIEKMITDAKIDKTNSSWRTTLPKPSVANFDSTHTYWCRMVTNKGAILIKFMPDVAPMHVTSFIYLTKLGFYRIDEAMP